MYNSLKQEKNNTGLQFSILAAVVAAVFTQKTMENEECGAAGRKRFFLGSG